MKNNSYDDIINLPHPVSKNHPQMPLRDRAAQFAPFAALTGHDAAIKETARLTDERLELSEEAIAQLNERINIIRNNIGIEQKVSITYFIPDAKKAGGSYVTCSNVIFPMHYWNDANVIKRFITEYPQYKSRIKNTECTKGEEL